MSGYYEIRVTGPARRHYRLFCLLDNGTDAELKARGFDRPQIAVINGMVKKHMTGSDGTPILLAGSVVDGAADFRFLAAEENSDSRNETAPRRPFR